LLSAQSRLKLALQRFCRNYPQRRRLTPLKLMLSLSHTGDSRMTRSQTFARDGKTYQVRAAQTDEGWRIAVFEGDHQFGGCSTVAKSEIADAKLLGISDPVKRVMDQAQERFLRGAK
jgi:hypothetical protein